MFSKAKQKDMPGVPPTVELEDEPRGDAAPVRRANASARGNSRPRPQNKAAAGVPSIISGDMIIRGSVESSGEVQFDGEIEGDIRADRLVVGESAKVAGEVVAEKVRISGTVEGAVRAVEVELAASAYVRGDIVHTSLSIESGARLEGNVAHSDDPMNTPVARPLLSRPAETGVAEPGIGDRNTDEDIVELQGQAAAMARREPTQSRELSVARPKDNGRKTGGGGTDRTLTKRPAGADLR